MSKYSYLSFFILYKKLFLSCILISAPSPHNDTLHRFRKKSATCRTVPWARRLFIFSVIHSLFRFPTCLSLEVFFCLFVFFPLSMSLVIYMINKNIQMALKNKKNQMHIVTSMTLATVLWNFHNGERNLSQSTCRNGLLGTYPSSNSNYLTLL